MIIFKPKFYLFSNI